MCCLFLGSRLTPLLKQEKRECNGFGWRQRPGKQALWRSVRARVKLIHLPCLCGWWNDGALRMICNLLAFFSCTSFIQLSLELLIFHFHGYPELLFADHVRFMTTVSFLIALWYFFGICHLLELSHLFDTLFLSLPGVWIEGEKEILCVVQRCCSNPHHA